jgi:hypothetical protein
LKIYEVIKLLITNFGRVLQNRPIKMPYFIGYDDLIGCRAKSTTQRHWFDTDLDQDTPRSWRGVLDTTFDKVCQ